MAKRRRLTMQDGAAAPLPAAGIETKAWLSPGAGLAPPSAAAPPSLAPPIARVAGEAAATAALREVSEAMTAVRAEGRLVARLALEAIADDHLLRDRLEMDREALDALIVSLRAHGQRTPIEVTEIGAGPAGAPRYGLISGWRRLSALRALFAETGDAKFGSVLALVRHPASPAEAYVAMVEENEVRLGVSHYERARIVARAADLGVFADDRAALSVLFASASRPRRSKIGSFVTVYRALDGALRFPAALPERLGLRLAKRAEAGGLAPLAQALGAAPAASAEAEQALIARFLADGAAADGGGRKPDAALPDVALPDVANPDTGGPAPQEVRPGVFLAVAGGFTRPVLTLSGPAVDAGFRERLLAWLDSGR